MQQISRGKFDRLQRTTAGFTRTRLDGYGLCCSLPTRPRVQASYPILVHRHALLLHPSFRPRLATTPLRFANPSPPSGWIRDLHPQTVEHARHTKTPTAWKRSRAPTLPHYGDGLNFIHRGLHRNNKDERTVTTACLRTCWTYWFTTTDRFIRTDTRATHPGQERRAPPKAEYICADLSSRPQLFPCSRTADHTFTSK
jgi:hypothetical protein